MAPGDRKRARPGLVLRARGAEPAPGPIVVQGSKNAFNHLAALALAGRDLSLRLDGTPPISDREAVTRILRGAGLEPRLEGNDLLTEGSPVRPHIDVRAGRQLRASICHAAALAANVGRAMCPFPGGDAFTARPIDLHLRTLAAAGAESKQSPDGASLAIRFPYRPRAFEVSLTTRYGPSMGASVTALLVAAQASGASTLRGLSPEPEVSAVAANLRALGVEIETLDHDVVRVRGVDGPLSGRLRAMVPPDRTEAATYLLVGALRQCVTSLVGIGAAEFTAGLGDVLVMLGLRLGGPVDGGPATTAVRTPLRPVSVTTGPYPQFPTDVQPPMTALLTQVHGLSWVTERVYASRVSHVPELARLGVRVGVNGADQYVLGRQRVRGGHALVRDIRCGAALLVAAAAADAPVTLHDPAGHLARGYGDLRAKLAHVGMDLEDVHDPGA